MHTPEQIKLFKNQEEQLARGNKVAVIDMSYYLKGIIELIPNREGIGPIVALASYANFYRSCDELDHKYSLNEYNYGSSESEG